MQCADVPTVRRGCDAVGDTRSPGDVVH
jgi:hypothetical protein